MKTFRIWSLMQLCLDQLKRYYFMGQKEFEVGYLGCH